MKCLRKLAFVYSFVEDDDNGYTDVDGYDNTDNKKNKWLAQTHWGVQALRNDQCSSNIRQIAIVVQFENPNSDVWTACWLELVSLCQQESWFLQNTNFTFLF